MALKPMVAPRRWPCNSRFTCSRSCAVDDFFAGFDDHPGGAALLGRRVAPPAAFRATRRTSPWLPSLLAITLGLGALGCRVFARNAFMDDKPYAFYALLAAAAVLVLALAERWRPLRWAWSPWRGARSFVRTRATVCRRSLSPLDRFAFGGDDRGDDLFLSRGARQSDRVRNLVVRLSHESIREDGIRAAIDAPDPQKKLPFILVPGSSGRMFDTTIHINNLGFRGPDLARDKGEAFRIVALGELKTFGPTLRDGEKPWPELLQDQFDHHASCGRKIEVITREPKPIQSTTSNACAATSCR